MGFLRCVLETAAIKRLEQELGCKLFDRHCNRIALNENGKHLQKSLCVVFDELEQVTADLAGTKAEGKEIRALVRENRSKIIDYIVEYKKKYPQVNIWPDFVLQEQDLENYNLIIDEERDCYPDFEKFRLCTMRIRIKASADSPLCDRALTLKQLCNQPFVVTSTSGNLHNLLQKVCKRAGFTPNIVMEVNDTHCYMRSIEAGLGIGLGRESFRYDAFGFRVECLDVTDFDERQTVCGYYKKSAQRNVQSFVDFLKSKAI